MVGDINQHSEETIMDVSVRVSASNGSSTTLPFAPHVQIKHRQEVLAVDTKGSPIRVRRAYALYQQQEAVSPGAKMMPSSLQGKTVIIERKGDHVTVKSEGAAIAQEDRDSLKDALNNDSKTMFPDRPVAVGEEWTPDPKAALKTFSGATKVVAHNKLVEFVTFAGHKCAHFHVSLELALPLKAVSAQMNLKLEGEGYEAMDIHRPLSLDLSGPVTVSGKQTQDDLTLQFGGSGTAHIKVAWEWLKVDGKPVTQNKPDASLCSHLLLRVLRQSHQIFCNAFQLQWFIFIRVSV